MKTTWMEVSKLLFDPKNHRLPPLGRRISQDSLLRTMDKIFRPEIIGRSIADNGFFPEEPLVVIPTSSGNYVVVEGNRRLAALKLLFEPGLRAHTRDPEVWNELAKRLHQKGHDITKVPVVIHKSREEITTFLGYRHIAGILRWAPLSKARFIDSLIAQKGSRADFAEVSRETGTSRNTMRDYYIAYRIYLQAKDEFEIDTSNMEKNLSVFVRAPARSQFIISRGRSFSGTSSRQGRPDT